MAETPPPYGQVKKSNSTTIIFIVLGVCAVCCVLGIAGVVGLGLFGIKKTKGTIACAVGFQEVGLALKAYAEEHNGKLPPADKWQDEVRPYFIREFAKTDQGSKMFGSFDPKGDWVCKDDAGIGTTGIAFNSDFSN